MRACLLLCAALALAPCRPRVAAAVFEAPVIDIEPERLEHIKAQILTKLGLSARPTPQGAPPRDVVRQILARAADPRPERPPDHENSMREIIAIAHRGYLCFTIESEIWYKCNIMKAETLQLKVRCHYLTVSLRVSAIQDLIFL